MRSDDMPKFAQLLAEVMAGFGKPLPEPDVIKVWFRQLMPFTPEVIRRAFADYALERPDFLPVPNSIASRCKLLDGRPDENAAWALALAARDERETVVWTEEMAEAFGLCRTLLDGGDEIGARMAFKEVYVRLVAAARAANLPAVWVVAAGWDVRRRVEVVGRAVTSGLLSAPAAMALLPPPEGAPTGDTKAREQLAKVRAMVAEMSERKEREREDAAARAQEEHDEWNRQTQQQVDAYQSGSVS